MLHILLSFAAAGHPSLHLREKDLFIVFGVGTFWHANFESVRLHVGLLIFMKLASVLVPRAPVVTFATIQTILARKSLIY